MPLVKVNAELSTKHSPNPVLNKYRNKIVRISNAPNEYHSEYYEVLDGEGWHLNRDSFEYLSDAEVQSKIVIDNNVISTINSTHVTQNVYPVLQCLQHI